MNRFIIFTLLFPLVAMLVFMSPDVVSKGKLPSGDDVLATLPVAYAAALVPAWLLMALDRALSREPLRLVGTTLAGAFMSASVARFFWGGFAGFWPLLMAGLVGAIPAAVCSWLSSFEMWGIRLNAVGTLAIILALVLVLAVLAWPR